MKAKFDTIYRDVVKQLNEQLPAHLTYHDTAHTLYVLEKAIDIAKKEKVKENELELVKVAALYHDIGFVKSQKDHEKVGCAIAQQQLNEYGFNRAEIETICGMIRATKIPQQPKNHLEAILADADLEYLATSKFEVISEKLYQELKHDNKDLTRDQWNQIQIDFIKKHKFHTPYCKHYKSFRKHKNLERLMTNF